MENIDVKIKKATIEVNLIRRLNPLLPHSSLLTVYKCFIRIHMDYESGQYNAAVTITGAIRGTSKEKLQDKS